jgi:cation diffusion facilitator family transporter
MTEPQATPPPPELSTHERARIARLKERAAIVSVFASIVLTLGKALAAWLSGSLALMSEAAHGLIDIGATLATWFAVRAAEKPADDDHHYGHGKVESLTALAEAALLFSLAGAVAWEAATRLWSGAHPAVEVTPLVLVVLVAAIMIDGGRWRALHIISRDTGSEALAADAMHFASDFVSSLLTLIGLIAVLAGYAKGDAVAALGVSIFVFGAAARLAARTSATLTDTAPKGLSGKVEAAALSVQGVEAVDWIRLRTGGGRVLGEVGVRVARTLPLEDAARIKAEVARALAAAVGDGAITITANPIQTDREDVLERVMVTAARLKTPVHHVGVQFVDGRVCISLDMEVDARFALARAHDMANVLEAAIRAEFGAGTEVETHIEPLDMTRDEGSDAAPDEVEQIKALLTQAAAEAGVLSDIHNVRMRHGPKGAVVNFHCRADGASDIASVHAAVDAAERGLRASRPDVARVVGHAEPVRV